MTPSPVVAPGRDGGRAVETNVDHEIGNDAWAGEDAAQNSAGSVDDNARHHGYSPALARFAIQPDANMRLAPHGGLLYDAI
jgi:hypothetical protein